jgi:hypothetical protein
MSLAETQKQAAAAKETLAAIRSMLKTVEDTKMETETKLEEVRREITKNQTFERSCDEFRA